MKNILNSKIYILSILFTGIITLVLLGTFHMFKIDASMPERLPISQLAAMQWKGGSLLHLKAELQILGCSTDMIYVKNQENEWDEYIHFNDDKKANQSFLDKYSEYIPQTTVKFSCHKSYRHGFTIDANENVQSKEDIIRNSDEQCSNDWNTLVQEHILPIMPLEPNLCVVRLLEGSAIEFSVSGLRLKGGGKYYPSNGYYHTIKENDKHIRTYMQLTNPYIVLNYRSSLHTEVHELCHAQQFWYLSFGLGEPVTQFHYNWNSSPAGLELIEISGFENKDGKWHLPTGPYSEIYSGQGPHHGPLELGAELCAMYLLERAGYKNYYSQEVHDAALTTEIREWMKKYIIVAK